MNFLSGDDFSLRRSSMRYDWIDAVPGYRVAKVEKNSPTADRGCCSFRVDRWSARRCNLLLVSPRSLVRVISAMRLGLLVA